MTIRDATEADVLDDDTLLVLAEGLRAASTSRDELIVALKKWSQADLCRLIVLLIAPRA